LIVLKALVVLTSSECKRLIGKGVAALPEVQKALKSGLIVIIKGTTNSYVAEEILGEDVDKANFRRGVVVPGLLGGAPSSERQIPDVVIEKGKVVKLTLEEAVPKLRGGDVLMKGANALDLFGIAGVYVASETSGTIDLSIGTLMARGVNFIIPVGLEKLIPTPIHNIVPELGIDKIDMSTGLKLGMMPVIGKVVTEIEAFEMLTGVSATNIGGGGVNGAEGSRTFLLKGEEKDVKKAFEIAKAIIGEPTFPKT
jgi:hypothetical protein